MSPIIDLWLLNPSQILEIISYVPKENLEISLVENWENNCNQPFDNCAVMLPNCAMITRVFET
jgi:hypothetical protein